MKVKKGRAVLGETPTTIVSNIRSKNISFCCAMSRFADKKYLIQHLTKFCFLTELHQKLDDLNLNGCCFIMDNVAFHKCTTIKEFFIASGHTVRYLPPYLPALNPIEEAFSEWIMLLAEQLHVFRRWLSGLAYDYILVVS